MKNLTAKNKVGVATRDISPDWPLFLAGYPNVERTSDGINDPLFASAIFLSDGTNSIIMVSVDLLMFSPMLARQMREEIEKKTGVPASNIMLSCTHTHSGPMTYQMLSRKGTSPCDSPDSRYMKFFSENVIASAVEAVKNAVPAEIAFTSAQISGVGTNRHDPKGPRDPECSIIVTRDPISKKLISLSLFYCMHPTVMHEDSKKVSSDFPGFARKFLNASLGKDLKIIYHTGPAGNQSPRYDVKGQTFAEAERLGSILGKAVLESVNKLKGDDFRDDLRICAAVKKLELPFRTFKPLKEAEATLEAARAKFAKLKAENAGHGPVRTAECDIFGAEKAVVLSKAQEKGEIAALVKKYNPVEVIMLGIGDVRIVGFPCEIFVEYGLAVKEKSPLKTFTVTLANGELQGYIVTKDSAAKGGYEAFYAIFLPESGDRKSVV